MFEKQTAVFTKSNLIKKFRAHFHVAWKFQILCFSCFGKSRVSSSDWCCLYRAQYYFTFTFPSAL